MLPLIKHELYSQVKKLSIFYVQMTANKHHQRK